MLTVRLVYSYADENKENTVQHELLYAEAKIQTAIAHQGTK